MSDKNSPIEVDTGPLPKISSLASNHLLKYDDCDGYLTSNDDGDDDDDGHTAYHNPERNLEIAIYLDDVAEFITQMELLFGSDDSNDSLEPGETVKPNTREPMLCPSRILSRICARGALACVTALLQGETCVYVDLNVPFDEGDFPLHLVASRQNYDLVKLFLYYGARTDLLDYFVSERVSLPLNAALEQLNKHPYFDYWSPVESMCRLLIILCLPQMKVALDTNRLLALHTEDVNEIFIDYAKEGKLIEMAVLLMVGNVRIIAPRTFQTKDGGIVEGGMTIRNTINDKSKVREYHGVYMGTLVPMCNGESASFTLTLLKLFVAAGDAIRSYIQSQTIHVPKEKVVNGVACILKESGFVLKETDIDLSNIDCESDHIKEVTGTSENNAAYESWKYGLMVLNVRITSFDEEDEEADLMSKDKDSGLSNIDCESNEIKEATDSSGNIIAYEPKMRPSMFPDRYRHFKPPWAWPIVPAVHPVPRPHCIMMANGYVRKFSSSEFFKLHKNQYKGEKNAMGRPMHPSISSNVLASLAMSFKRGLRRV